MKYNNMKYNFSGYRDLRGSCNPGEQSPILMSLEIWNVVPFTRMLFYMAIITLLGLCFVSF